VKRLDSSCKQYALFHIRCLGQQGLKHDALGRHDYPQGTLQAIWSGHKSKKLENYSSMSS